MHAPTGDSTSSRPLIERILVRRSAYRHPYAWGAALFAAGIWLFVLGGILCSTGFWWGALLIAVSMLQFAAGYLLLSRARR